MKKLIGVIVLLLAAFSTFAQNKERTLIQFSGIIHNADSVSVIVPYVSINNLSYNASVNISNYKGYFSFVAHELDTLRFTCVGYAPITVIIPGNVPSKSFTLQVLLKPEIINLPVFHVFPWATTEEFTKDFISMKIADDDLEIARKNLNHASISTME